MMHITGSGIAIGIAVGIAIGMALNTIGAGIGIGIALAIAMSMKPMSGKPRKVRGSSEDSSTRAP